jgi:hypothetical protein
MKIRPVGTEFHADGQTDMKLIVAFRNFANAPNNQFILSSRHFILSDVRFNDIQIPPPIHRLFNFFVKTRKHECNFVAI